MSEITGRLGSERDAEPGDQPEPANGQVDARTIRRLRRQLAAGATAITTVFDGGYRASTVAGVLMASIEPPLLLISLEGDGQMAGWIEEYSDVLLGLGCGHRGSQGDRLCDGVRAGADQLALR